MSLKEKLKYLTIDNLIAGIIGAILYIGAAMLFAYNILPNLAGLWFAILFIGFGILMYNLVALMGVEHLQRKLYNDIRDLSDGKIDGLDHGKEIK